MSLTQTIAGSTLAPEQIDFPSAHEDKSLDRLAVRSALLLAGYSIRSWAKAQGVSSTIVFRLIYGDRPGVRGKSAKIRAKLLALKRAA